MNARISPISPILQALILSPAVILSVGCDGDDSPNRAPAAQDASTNVIQDVPAVIVLQATDADRDPLTYEIVDGPLHGTLSGAGPELTYTPEPGYTGSDSFTFRAFDGREYGNTATVTIAVTGLPMAQIAEAGAYIVPRSANNTVRFTWDPPDYDPDSVVVDVVDSGGGVVRTISGLPVTFEAGQDFAEHRWNGCADAGGTQPLTEASSPYTIRLTAWWSGQESSAEVQALVEEWLLDIGIGDGPGGSETLVSGPDERSVTSANIEVRVSLDGNPAVTPAFSVTANTEVAGGPAANERGCLVTPSYVFYTTPKTPHDIRYQVVVEENTATSTVAPDGLLLSTVVDGALNPWDMDPIKAGRQTRCTWEFGLDSSGSPPAAARGELVEAYEP